MLKICSSRSTPGKTPPRPVDRCAASVRAPTASAAALTTPAAKCSKFALFGALQPKRRRVRRTGAPHRPALRPRSPPLHRRPPPKCSKFALNSGICSKFALNSGICSKFALFGALQPKRRRVRRTGAPHLPAHSPHPRRTNLAPRRTYRRNAQNLRLTPGYAQNLRLSRHSGQDADAPGGSVRRIGPRSARIPAAQTSPLAAPTAEMIKICA